ncbi:hypothetical protein CBER1_09817 [Cercospora berteroae]|uniref:Oxidoreductase acuF-like C2H2 type zinc-finger domain-containing protein n=1 Tax=Cercospora berteroae TaxID=357750 RepID=A0A2S6BX51_9PEZI|nr:hypothetical protein CBER1_09817 [Cercospora berteroae]
MGLTADFICYEANAIIKGERVPLDELEFSDSDASEMSLPDAYDDSTELEQIVDDIAEIVTHLFDLSRSLSSANARELMSDASNVDMQHFKFSDRLEVQLQFPRASREIIERLVMANNKRRQIFKFVEEHRTVMSGTVHVDSYSSTTQPEVPQSTARVLSSDSIEESGEVTTDEHLQLPVIPNQVLEGVPLTCPYCHEALHVSNVKSWRLHVMEDLKPLRDHLLSDHDHLTDEATIGLCESSASLYDMMECPLYTTPTSDFRNHVSQHLWTVALNTLPLPQDSAPSNVDTESVNYSEADELESQTSDVAMLEPEQELMEVEVSEVAQSGSTHADPAMPQLDHNFTEVQELDAQQQDLPDVPSAVTVYEECSEGFNFRGILGQALSDASRRGNADVMGFLLKLNDVDPNFKHNVLDLRMPLVSAAVNGHSKIVQMLLDEPTVEIEAQDFENATPLSLAAAYGHLDVVQILVDKGADIEARNKYLDTPLCRAALVGYVGVVEVLIRAGADPDARSSQGHPLWIATSTGHENMVEFLLRAGAYPNKVDQ